MRSRRSPRRRTVISSSPDLYRDTDRPDLALVEVEQVLAIQASSPTERAVLTEAIELEEELAR